MDNRRRPTIVFGKGAENHAVRGIRIRFFESEGRPLIEGGWAINWDRTRWRKRLIEGSSVVSPDSATHLQERILRHRGKGGTLLLSSQAAVLLYLGGQIIQAHLNVSLEVVDAITTIPEVTIGGRTFVVQILRDQKTEFVITD